MVVNLGYSGLLGYSLIKHRKEIRSKVEAIVRIVIECFLTILLISFLIYDSDPTGKDFTSKTRENWELTSMISVFVIVVLQCARLLVSWFKQMSANNEQSPTAPVKNNKVSHYIKPQNNGFTNIENVYDGTSNR
jgi:hypothetical protein